MIKALVLLTLVVSTYCTTFEVILFRGQIPLLTAKLDFKNNTSNEIVLRDYVLSDYASSQETSWTDVVCVDDDDQTMVNLPLRRTGTWSKKSTSYLGVVLQSTYTTDNNDKFQISIAFGACCNNDFEISDFTTYLADIEVLRQNNSAEIIALLAKLKTQASAYISAVESYANLEDENVDNQTQLDTLTAQKTELQSSYDTLLETIDEKLEDEFSAETEASEACANSRISESSVNSLNDSISVYQSTISGLKSSLTSETTLTTDETSDYETLCANLKSYLASASAYNSKMTSVTLSCGSTLDADLTRPLYPASN